jgi:predicted dehydrogenase
MIDRREFLKTAGSISAGSLVLPSFTSGKMANYPRDVIKIGIIGTGSRGKGLMEVMQDIPQFKLVAICDILPFRLKEASSITSNTLTKYNDYKELLANPNIDAVVIATPLHLHYKMAMDAVEAGLHVYCEKTMTFQIEEALNLVKKCKESNKVFQVGYQYRSTPLYFQVAQIIRDGYLGKVTNVYIQWNRNHDWRRNVPDPKYEREINWRMYREFSGGLTAELHSHQIDYVNWIFDQHPKRIMGMGGIDYWKDGRETFDNVNTLLEYPEGMKVNCVALTANAFEGYLLRFKGSKGTIVLDMVNAWAYLEEPNAKEIGTMDGVSGATLAALSKEGIKIDPESDHPEWSNTRFALQGCRHQMSSMEQFLLLLLE